MSGLSFGTLLHCYRTVLHSCHHYEGVFFWGRFAPSWCNPLGYTGVEDARGTFELVKIYSFWELRPDALLMLLIIRKPTSQGSFGVAAARVRRATTNEGVFMKGVDLLVCKLQNMYDMYVLYVCNVTQIKMWCDGQTDIPLGRHFLVMSVLNINSSLIY